MASSPSATAALDAPAAALNTRAETGWRLRAFAVALIGYGYIIAVGIGAAAALPFGAELALTYGRDASLPVRLVVNIGAFLLVYSAFWIGWSTLVGFFLARPSIDGIELAPNAGRPLRKLIADIAFELRVRAPTTIAFTCDGSSWLSIKTYESGRRATGIYIGIATLLALPPDELAATLAHELAHLRTRDARLTCFIERALARWCAYAVRFSDRRKFGALPLALVSRWFIRQLSGPLARLSRTDEFAADREAARCTSAIALAHALERVAIESLRAEELLWPRLEQDALSGKPLPGNYCARWLSHLESEDPEALRIRWRRLAMYQQPIETDSHPPLADRIYALDAAVGNPELQVDEHENAIAADSKTTLGRLDANTPLLNATTLLADDWPHIRAEVDRVWREASSEQWAIANDHGNELRAMLESETNDSAPSTVVTRALAIEELGDRSRAIALLEQVVEEHHEFDEARFHLARLLFAEGDKRGVRHMDAVIEANDAFRITGMCYAIDYMIREGRLDDADAYQRAIDASASVLESAERERSQLTSTDTFSAHGLEQSYVSRAVELLSSIAQIQSAYLLRKQLNFELGDRIYVLAVDAPARFWRMSLDDVELRELLESRLMLPGETEVAILTGWESWLRSHVDTIEGSCIYRKN
jgi:Zn-dependent protease with chaperone function